MSTPTPSSYSTRYGCNAKAGYKNSRIKSAIKTLKAVANQCNISNPVELKTYLATAAYTQNRKHKIITDADRLYKQIGIKWERPRCGPVEMPTFLPTEEEINQLIGGLGPKLAAFMMTVKDTYARAGEIFNLKWTDFDPNTNTVNITPEKGSNPRRIKLKTRTVAALLARPRTYLHIFRSDQVADIEEAYDDLYRNFAKHRAKIASTRKSAHPPNLIQNHTPLRRHTRLRQNEGLALRQRTTWPPQPVIIS